MKSMVCMHRRYTHEIECHVTSTSSLWPCQDLRLLLWPIHPVQENGGAFFVEPDGRLLDLFDHHFCISIQIHACMMVQEV